ncbi:hypothetical protein HDV05_005532 [Chytridiales sp. JEL 0842]|nr:hypothetical protein HDV05_005532 [Chytridiales sp. JEL 0842]
MHCPESAFNSASYGFKSPRAAALTSKKLSKAASNKGPMQLAEPKLTDVGGNGGKEGEEWVMSLNEEDKSSPVSGGTTDGDEWSRMKGTYYDGWKRINISRPSNMPENYAPINDNSAESIFHFGSRPSKSPSSNLKIQAPERALEVDRLNLVMGAAFKKCVECCGALTCLSTASRTCHAMPSTALCTVSTPLMSRKMSNDVLVGGDDVVVDEKKVDSADLGTTAARVAPRSEESDEPPPSYAELM